VPKPVHLEYRAETRQSTARQRPATNFFKKYLENRFGADFYQATEIKYFSL
jgi:hypothetical protein